MAQCCKGSKWFDVLYMVIYFFHIDNVCRARPTEGACSAAMLFDIMMLESRLQLLPLVCRLTNAMKPYRHIQFSDCVGHPFTHSYLRRLAGPCPWPQLTRTVTETEALANGTPRMPPLLITSLQQSRFGHVLLRFVHQKSCLAATLLCVYARSVNQLLHTRTRRPSGRS